MVQTVVRKLPVGRRYRKGNHSDKRQDPLQLLIFDDAAMGKLVTKKAQGSIAPANE